MSDPLLQAARLWERTSERGTRYMSGRLGGVKVVILPNRDHAADDPMQSHTHTMYFQAGSSTQPRQKPTAPAEPRERSRRESPRQQIDDDVVPF